jgi:DNA-binding MarR family transcriptional regulator
MTLPILPCACATLRRASRALTQVYEDEMRGSGLRATQLTILMTLAKAGELGQGRLAALLAFDPTTLTRTLGILRRRDLVELRRGRDRRERRVVLSGKGRTLLAEQQPRWERAQHRVRQVLGADYERLQELLHRVSLIGERA